jgi:hypothetical protein
MLSAGESCPDCGCAPGSLHDLGCLKERCPFCDGQLPLCECIFDVLQLNERTIVEEFVDHTEEPLKSILDRWEAALNAKGRIPW